MPARQSVGKRVKVGVGGMGPWWERWDQGIGVKAGAGVGRSEGAGAGAFEGQSRVGMERQG